MNNRSVISQSHDEEETVRIAQDFADLLRSKAASNKLEGQIICLHGTLGMGKSVFARALIRALCENKHLDVPSPTFTLVQNYDAIDGTPIYHFDLYRLEDPNEMYELGWEDASSEGLCIIEWPERLGGLMPRKRIDIIFEQVKDEPQQRQIIIDGLSDAS